MDLLSSLYVGTQLAYFGSNVATWYLLSKKPSLVEMKEPSSNPSVTAFLPLYDETEKMVRANVNSLNDVDYPHDKIDICALVEEHDQKTQEVVKKTMKDYKILNMEVIPSNNNKEWEKIYKRLDEKQKAEWWHKFKKKTTDFPMGKPRALTYGLFNGRTNGEVISLFDAEDIVDPQLFKYAVAGLDQYDVVQSKIKIGNAPTNLLTSIASVDYFGWDDFLYPHTTDPSMPPPLLGPSYFVKRKTIEDVGGWNVFNETEDFDLGIRLWRHGYRLGLLDIYTREETPKTFSKWLNQRTRWCRGIQKTIKNADLSLKDRLKVFTYSLNLQVGTVNNLVGYPVGLAVLGSSLMGNSLEAQNAISLITMANGVHWMGYLATLYKSIFDNRTFISEERKEQLKCLGKMIPFYFPYSFMWALPIVRGFYQNVSMKLGNNVKFWEKTPHPGLHIKKDELKTLEEKLHSL